jgi:hypothetical protein
MVNCTCMVDQGAEEVPEHVAQAVAEGFPWECPCGEMHRTGEAAATCRKCREYLSWEDWCAGEPRCWAKKVS